VGVAGTNIITVTPSGSTSFGMWAGELANAGTPVSGMTTNAGLGFGPANVGWTAMTVTAAGTWAAVATNTADVPEVDFQSLGTFDAGPTQAGVQSAGLTYGIANANVPAGTGWYLVDGGAWVSVGIVVPPG
jgi:hypothetical protein